MPSRVQPPDKGAEVAGVAGVVEVVEVAGVVEVAEEFFDPDLVAAEASHDISHDNSKKAVQEDLPALAGLKKADFSI